ncbi:MAG: hypothetical protein HY292_05700 [Planctomycetes bacterium]|nr:hypothetical protein [Planctomycetota bacterium]
MKTPFTPGLRSTMYFALFLVLLSSLLIATTTLPAQRNNEIMRDRRQDLVEKVFELEGHRTALEAEEGALDGDPVYVERLHRSVFGSVSSGREIRVQ